MTKSELRVFVLCAGFGLCIQWPNCDSLAQSYPVKPVRLLVGFAAGGTDTAARIFAQKMTEHLGHSFVVENRPGASGAIANERVAGSPADGYTLLLMPSSGVAISALRSNLPYDLVRDFAPISLVAMQPFALVVHPSLPVRNVKELIALARARPGDLSYGSNGVGSAVHLATELFKSMAGVNIVHVPYKGSTESAVATAAGHVELSFPGLASAIPLLESGKIRALAVTSARRSSLMPAIPTIDESGLPGYDRTTWFGVLAPVKVPKEIVDRLAAAIDKVINTAEMKNSLNRQGLDPQTNTQQQFAALIRNELAQNAKLIKLIGLKAE
jgi:tripartite-type tricarboxylate transporter receptor subunit TctC